MGGGEKDAIASSDITKAPFHCESTDNLPSNDPSELLPELLDRLIALGDMAQQLSQALGRNGKRRALSGSMFGNSNPWRSSFPWQSPPS